MAELLFGWDTTTGLVDPDDYAHPILDDAEATGDDLDALKSDLDGYLPTEQAWPHLADYHTRQTLTIEHAYVPDTWADIAADAGSQIPAGVVAVTIDGTRERTGVWNGHTVRTEHPVALTVFVACEPAFERCHTLRLSAPETPLR